MQSIEIDGHLEKLSIRVLVGLLMKEIFCFIQQKSISSKLLKG
jgi:hypothetical protein